MDALFLEAPLGVDDESLEDALTSAVMGHELRDGVAFCCCVLGVAADIKVEA
ncbi:unannotated protein [freshwater metagenome]|uniref:Unannotated protein n=1 Tax=freshwater metagenome TaxID=449393 RepID=A0A6J7J921_9ZZZZ